jgi:hypothetical protein
MGEWPEPCCWLEMIDDDGETIFVFVGHDIVDVEDTEEQQTLH